MVNVLVIIELFTIIMEFSCLALLLSGDASREQKLMSYFIGGALVQNAGYVLELMAPTVEAALVAVKMQYLGSAFVPICYCWFMYGYCYEKAPGKLLRPLTYIDTALLLVIYTNEWHHLYYREAAWRYTQTGHGYLDITYGPFYYVFMLCGCAIPFVLSIFVLCRATIRSSAHAASRKYKVMIALSMLPVVALISYATKITGVFDFTPAVLGIVLSVVVILIWSRRNYDFGGLASKVVLHDMMDGVIVFDDQRRIVSYNPAAETVFPELPGCTTGDDIENLRDFDEILLNNDGKGEFERNNRIYECHVKQIIDKNEGVQGYVILILDMTEMRSYAEEIQLAREQAEKANKAKSEFLANMSHEIRTPMNAITGLSDIIMEESWGRAVYTYACDIKEAAQSLLTIINDILDLSKIEAGRMELVTEDYYVKSVVSEVVNMMGVEASRRGILMKYSYDMAIPCQYHGDKGRIKQILINLLNNALKFTKEGYVMISVRGMPADTPDTEWLVFDIEDTGCGIKEENLEKIFADFVQVDSAKNRSAEGTGLGLSITKHLTEMMGGKIEVKSVFEQGTTFTVTIPQPIVDRRTLNEMPTVLHREQEKVRMFVAEGYKVLVVDDNRINRSVVINLLKNYGFKVKEAASGREAIELVREEVFHIIFMDHMMPEMDGIEAVQIIRTECGENGRTPIIIALTANAMDGVREKFLQNGFQDFVAKPIDRKCLHQTLERWIPKECRKEQTVQDGGRNHLRRKNQLSEYSIEGIDLHEVREHYSGSDADYRELLSLYVVDGRRKQKLLQELLEKENYKDYEIEVHGLKSASANIGAMELSAAAKAHEMAASRGDTAYIREHFEGLLSAYESQLRHIQEFLEQTADADAGAEEQEVCEIDRKDLIEVISQALDKLSHFRSKECAERLEGLQKYRMEEDVRQKLGEIQEHLKLYEDDKAEQLLQELLNWLKEEE